MDSFDRLLEIGFEGRSPQEIAEIFLWYHLHRYPAKNTASIKRIQRYFERAAMPVPSERQVRNAFFNNISILPAVRKDRFSIAERRKKFWEEIYGSCFEPQSRKEKILFFVEKVITSKPIVWIGRIAFIMFAIVVIIAVYSIFK